MTKLALVLGQVLRVNPHSGREVPCLSHFINEETEASREQARF